VVEVESGKVLRCVADHHGPVTTVAISPDGKRVASGGWDGEVHLEENGKTRVLQLAWAIRRVRFSSDGKLLAVAAWTPQNATGKSSAPSALIIQLDPN
jgi:WD40 repeat protein